MSTPLHDLVFDRLAPIVPVLLDEMPKIVTAAEDAAASAGLPASYRSTRVHFARGLLHHRLSDIEADLGSWHIDRKQINCGVHLYSDDVVLRFLHSTTVVPAPGRNRARRAWYSNTPLDENPALFETPERLLLIWGADFRQGLVALDVVHPVGVWDFGRSSRIDLSIPIDDVDDFLAGGFDTRDEDEDIEMPNREEAAEDANDASA